MTINQTRLIRSLEIKIKALPQFERRLVLTELTLTKAVYGGENCGLTFELALQDLYERVKEMEQQTKEIAA